LKGKLILSVFVLDVLLNLVSHIWAIPELEVVSKPLLMPLLILLVWVNSKGMPRNILLLLFGALIFSWVGDVALLFDEKYPFLFMVGLGGFLIAHIQYIILFIKSAQKVQITKGITPFVIVLMFGYTMFLIQLLWPHLGELQIPVFVYATVLMLMGVFAVSRQVDNGKLLVILGAVLFVTSDSILAINKFYSPIENGRVLTMLTYTLAQLLIVIGILRNTTQNTIT
jgi:uncharacterized membrane protein YhhN